MIRSFLAEVFSDFTNLIYPVLCAGCTRTLAKGEDLICVSCLSDLPKLTTESPEWSELEIKLKARMPFASCCAYLRFHKTGMVRNILHNLKYSNCPELGIRLGSMFAMDHRVRLMDFGGIIPVPLHSTKKAKRGYNQSEMIARGLSEVLAIPVLTDTLKKTNRTTSQTGHSRISRWMNVQSDE